ncbi:MAG: hypothetical protein GX128_08570 [Bacteroidales bacterium]|nr:hypothetical protein [Bacteroidales bacterium]
MPLLFKSALSKQNGSGSNPSILFTIVITSRILIKPSQLASPVNTGEGKLTLTAPHPRKAGAHHC